MYFNMYMHLYVNRSYMFLYACTYICACLYIDVCGCMQMCYCNRIWLSEIIGSETTEPALIPEHSTSPLCTHHSTDPS